MTDPVAEVGVNPTIRQGRRRNVLSVVVVQALVIAAVVVYAAWLPLDPDHGLQQLDALTLHEHVPGVDAVAGRPTLYIATGPLAAPHCKAMAGRLLAHRGRPDGLSQAYGVVLLVPRVRRSSSSEPLVQIDPHTQIREDPAGRLAAALALPRAGSGCQPGYAVVDPAGIVRYRTYDADYAHHPQEQTILLDATARR